MPPTNFLNEVVQEAYKAGWMDALDCLRKELKRRDC